MDLNFKPRYYIFIFFLYAFVFTNNCKAQHLIQGIVRDKNTEEPISGVVVSAGNIGTQSDLNGFFKLNIPEAGINLNFRFLGYETLTITETMNGKDERLLKVFLNPSKKLLDQVVVTGNRNEQAISRSTSSVEVIGSKLILDKGTTNMDKFLNQIPSVSVLDGQINIRSGSGWTYGAGSRVMVLVDDLPFLTGDAGQVKWSLLPLENLKQVEVIKGAGSVLYGSGALNGIVHFRTQMSSGKPITKIQMSSGIYDKPDRIGLRWSNKNLFKNQVSLFHAAKIGKFQYAFSSNYMKDEGYRMSDNEERIRCNLNVQTAVNKDLKIGLNLGVLKSTSQSFLLWENDNLGYTVLDSQATGTSSQSVFVDPSISFHQNGFQHRIKSRWMYINNENSNVTQNNAFHQLYAEYQVQKNFTEISLQTTGGLVSNFNTSEAQLYGGRNTSENIAAFIQLDKIFFNKLNIGFGARHEYFKMNNDQTQKPVFRAGMNYEITKSSFFRCSWGQGFRYPSIAERYINTSVGSLNIFANPNLKAESGWSAEIGFKQGFKFGKLTGYIDLAYFDTRYNDMTEFNFGAWKLYNPANPYSAIGFKSFNIGATSIKGFDASAGFQLKQKDWEIQGIAGYTYSLPLMLDPNLVFAYDSARGPQSFTNTRSDSVQILKYRFEHQVKFDISIQYKKLELGYSYKYNSNIKNIDMAFVAGLIPSIVPGIAEARTALNQNRSLSDIRIFYHFKPTIKLGFNCLNLFNTEMMNRPADLIAPRFYQLQIMASF